LGANYQINNVVSIFVSDEIPGVRISVKNSVDFSIDPNLKGFLSYKNIAIPIEVDSSTQEGKDFVEQFKKDLPRGVFSDVLKKIQDYIAAGTITGFSDEEFIGLAPIFNNIRGRKVTNQQVRDLMSYLNKFMLYVAKESKDIDTATLVTESIIKMKDILTKKIKQKLKVDKFIKPIVQKDDEQPGSKIGTGDKGGTQKSNQQAFIDSKDMPEPEENPEEIQKKKDQNLQSLNKALRKQ
jgi:hypothetical protein